MSNGTAGILVERDGMALLARRWVERSDTHQLHFVEVMGFARAQPILRIDNKTGSSDLPVGQFVDRRVESSLQKYFPFRAPQITSRTFRIPPHRGAYHDRHERGVGCGGRGSVLRAMGSQGESKDS
jgi:hypothetical protein